MSKQDLMGDTPIVKVNLEKMEDNIRWLAQLAKEANVKLRPHTKTHKSPFIAHEQLKAGASGITTATLGEAEVMANSGIKDILIAFPIIGAKKLERFQKLFENNNLIVGLDDYKIAIGLNEVGSRLNKKVPIYFDIDTGLGRMGRMPEESIEHIYKTSELPFIDVIGLMSHTGHAYKAQNEEEMRKIAIEEATKLNDVKNRLKEKDIIIKEISVGASATARFIKDIPFITEVRAGMYVFNDRMVMGAGGANINDCALTIWATIVSKPNNNRMLIDAGSKTLTYDSFKGGGYGYIKGHENLTINNLSEEHGFVEVTGHTNLEIGDVVEIIPNHVCPVVNLTDNLFGFRNNEFERIISVEARGKNR
ncbi:alanine racemase [Planococcus beigongshangi]|uniref:alanine racemase n=1 Tax=Planococcus beigongshangi TaxID=2782536 RepID=UPI00193C604E|nr:alanine racemase [Planococcus beigongshangi]